MCAGAAHSEAEKTTGQRRDEEGLLQRVRNPHTPAHEVRRAVALLFPKGVYRGCLSMCTSAISALGRVHACEEALALLETMPQRALTPNVISYSAAMSACEKGGQWQRALELLEGMPQRALKPDVISYNAATSVCEKGGQWQRALELLEGMRQRALKPDVISYNAAM